MRSAHGAAVSSWAATRTSRSSRPWAATSWTPIGKPDYQWQYVNAGTTGAAAAGAGNLYCVYA